MKKLSIPLYAIIILSLTGCNMLSSLLGPGTTELFKVEYFAPDATSGYPPVSRNYRPGTQVVVEGYGNLARTNYTPSGWNDGRGNTYTPGKSFPMPSANVNLFVVWIPASTSYPVTYNANGATAGTAPAAQDKFHGQTLELAYNSGGLSKTGHAFMGWNTAADGTGVNYDEGAEYTANAALNLYAKWMLSGTDSYPVTYDANGATSGTVPADQSKTRDVTLTLATNTGGLYRDGYSFIGWNTAANGAGMDYSTGSIYTANAPLTLYAKWAANTYSVTYDANGATDGNAPTAQTKTHDVPLTLAANTGGLLKDGHTFAGWNTAPNGGGSNYTEGASYSTNSALTLYARWVPNTYPVTYIANSATGGDAPAAQEKVHGVTLTLSGNIGGLYKDGATFAGWNTAANGMGTNYAEGASYSTNAPLTLYAKWIASSTATYTVSYDANGATAGTVPSAQTKTKDVALTLAGNTGGLTKDGFTFAGWNTMANGTGTSYAEGAVYTTNAALLLYAKWVPVQTYSVSYNANGATGGAVPATQTKVHDVPLTLAGNTGLLVRTDFTFAGWNTASDGTGTNYSEGASYSANAPVSLYAKWIPVTVTTYTVSYNANGATSGTVPVTQTKTQDVSLILADNTGLLAKTGYIFAGWNTSSSGAGTDYAAGAAYTTNAALNLYAKWIPVTYSISYNANGATSGSAPGAQTKAHDATLILAGNTGLLARTGYTFSGWNTAADGSGTSYAENAEYTANAGLVLYAKWTPLSYTVTYNANGATNGTVPSVQTKIYGVPLTLQGNTGLLVKDGSTFVGWNTAASGTGSDYSEGASYTANASVTLYAKWIAAETLTYTVAYNANGATSGTVPTAQTKTQDIPLTLAGNTGSLVKTGHVFSGWNTSPDGTGTNYAGGDSYTINAALTLYAKWVPLTFTVSYNANFATGGTLPPAQAKTYDVPLTLSGNTGNLSRIGYTFIGWNTKADGTGINYAGGDIYTTNAPLVLYAKWLVNTYTITFHANDGSGVIDSKSVIYGQTIFLANGFIRPYYTFIGWAASPSSITVDYPDMAQYTVGAFNLNLYAVWESNYASEYEDIDIGFGNDGEQIDIGFVDDGEPVEVGFSDDGEPVDIGFEDDGEPVDVGFEDDGEEVEVIPN